MSKTILVALFFIGSATFGQTYIKANGLTALALVPNIGIETSLSNKVTFQVDVVASFWNSINGGPFQFFIVTPEIRYHFKENYTGFYIGAHLAGGTFKLQKWNYSNTDLYQKGYNYFVGATVGYQRILSQKVMLEFFLGGGNQEAFYKGYYLNAEGRYETADKYNKSGEWLLYRGGIMISYKID
jgi:hypothetical protein